MKLFKKCFELLKLSFKLLEESKYDDFILEKENIYDVEVKNEKNNDEENR